MPGAGGIAAIGIGASLAGSFLGGGGDAASEAAAAQAAAKQRAIETLQRNLAPFRDAGTQALPGLQQASTIGGLDERLGQIFGGGQFQNLVGERSRAVQGQLAASGQSRSGAGLLAAARVPTDIGLQLEQLTQGRLGSLAGMGLNAAGNLGGGVAGLQAGIGQDIGSGILGDAQAQAAQFQNALNTGIGAAGLFAPTAGAPLQGGAPGGGGQFIQQQGFGGGGFGGGNPGTSVDSVSASLQGSLFGGF
jgi:hypothetical protein